jgi:hypothetical protein
MAFRNVGRLRGFRKRWPFTRLSETLAVYEAFGNVGRLRGFRKRWPFGAFNRKFLFFVFFLARGCLTLVRCAHVKACHILRDNVQNACVQVMLHIMYIHDVKFLSVMVWGFVFGACIQSCGMLACNLTTQFVHL